MSEKLIIAIETSGRVGSAAIGRGNELISDISFSGFMKHSAELHCTLEKLLHQANASPDDVEQCYITAGPGSFTGLRIAVTAAKMFYFTQKAQIIAADSMDVIAESASRYAADTGQTVDCIATILDAKKDLFYAAVFDRVDESWKKCLGTGLFSVEQLLDWLETNKKKDVGLLGEGLVYYAEKFKAPFTHLLDESYWSATAAGLFRVGRRMATEEQFADPFALTPRYIRGANAAVKRPRKKS
ncbi:MAG: tRNA (adenosine(37)-N6)-threonylcarbamoyltransferase complex dimerization subunit type 1 TsaB [Planctomycetales bacterium 4572_13]|nr:MAG: tRNA (adenosine(37)-N6)-threonylcarbamoyltransferase complex dimerization subunit type 1 TsaB [Planctomycetales bacterium 4572_13]